MKEFKVNETYNMSFSMDSFSEQHWMCVKRTAKSVFFVQVLGNSIGEKMTKRIKIEDDIRPSDRNQEVYEYINTATWSSAPWLRSLDVVS